MQLWHFNSQHLLLLFICTTTACRGPIQIYSYFICLANNSNKKSCKKFAVGGWRKALF